MAGNANSGRGRDKPFSIALRMELLAAGDDYQALRAVAAMLIAKAQEGDMQAIKELADRTDGKVPQGIVGDDEGDAINIIHRIERVIVRPSNPDS